MRPDRERADTATMDGHNRLSADDLLARLTDQIALLREGDEDAAVLVDQTFTALHYALSVGAPLPTEWAHRDPDSTVVITADDDGTILISAPSEETSVPAVPVFEEGDQFGFSFDEPEPEPERLPQVIRFPKVVKAQRGTPRKNSPATVDRPVDAPSLFPSGPAPVGLHSPSTSHEAVRYTPREITSHQRAELFWLVMGISEETGLCVFEATAILQRAYPDADLHHGKVSGRMNWLMNNGYVEDSGVRRRSLSNRNAIAWVPTEWAKQRVAQGYEVPPERMIRAPRAISGPTED